MRAMTIQGSYVGSLTDMAELLDLVQRTGVPPVPMRDAPARRGQRRAQRSARRQGRRPRRADAGATLILPPGGGITRRTH